MACYIFFRGRYWYPVDIANDREVLRHVALNPGTTKVETANGRIVWDGKSALSDHETKEE